MKCVLSSSWISIYNNFFLFFKLFEKAFLLKIYLDGVVHIVDYPNYSSRAGLDGPSTSRWRSVGLRDRRFPARGFAPALPPGGGIPYSVFLSITSSLED